MNPPVDPIVRPELGFPAWIGDRANVSKPTGVCPVSTEEMAAYLSSNQLHLCLDEAPTNFANFALRSHFSFAAREFWVWACNDDFGRVWDIIVGSGTTPFAGQSGNALWMHAERNSGTREPRDLIDREFPEHRNEQVKAN